MRLNHFVAESGLCSRRQADELIQKGRVLVNHVPGSPGQQVEEADLVTLDGKPIRKAREQLLLFHKPVGVVCSRGGNDRAVTAEEYLKLKTHLFPIGRLDKDSEGLLLLTNMGGLAEKVARAGETHEKEYIVTVKRPLSGSFIDRMRRGVWITIPENRSTTGREEKVLTRPCKVTRLDEKTFTIILTEGKNRQIRRMTAALGNQVERLRRVRIMNICLGDLPEGKMRAASEEEIKELKRLILCADSPQALCQRS